MAVPPAMLQYHLEQRKAKGGAAGKPGYPPTMFVHMPRDTHTAEFVKHDIAVLKQFVSQHVLRGGHGAGACA